MASTVLAGAFNAFAFAGAGWLFKQIDHSGYVAEMKRHDKAMEQLAKARDQWSEARLQELDRLSKLHYDKDQANKDIMSTNKDFLLVETKFEVDHPRPELRKYYKPSDTMSDYVTFVKLAVAIPVMYGLVSLV